MDEQPKASPTPTPTSSTPSTTPSSSSAPADTSTPADKPAAEAPETQPSGSGPSVTPSAQSGSGDSAGNRLRWLIPLAVVVIIAAVAYYFLNKVNKPVQPVAQSTKKTVSLLRVGVTQPFPSTFYPGSEPSVFPIAANSQIFEGLTQYVNENQLAPNLAISWTNPNTTTWDFKLRSGVKFHDGNPLTAQAVVASLNALKPTPYGQQFETTVKNVTAKDPSTVEITTTNPDPLLPSELANLWIYDTASGKTNDPANGTGPYTIKPGTKLTANSLDLVAVPDYHGGAPLTKEVLYKYYSSVATETSDVKKGLLDIADLTSLSAVNAVQSYGYKAYADKDPQIFFLFPNSRRAGSPLSKLAVRKAVYEGLNPLAIMKADGRTGAQATQMVPQEIPGYNPSVTPPKMDVTKAKSDLAAAGYPNGFTITFTYFASHQAVAQEVEKEMNAMGIKLNMDPETDGAVLQQKALGGQTDMFYFGYGSGLIDSSDVIGPLLVQSPNYDNPNVDKLYSQASTTFDSQARLKLLQQLNKMVMDDVAVFPLYNPDALYFAAKNNLVLHTDNLTNYMGVDFWKVYSQ